MKFLNKLAQLILFCFVLSVSALAQPLGNTCVFDYNPFEIKELGYVYGPVSMKARFSTAVYEERLKSQYIFIGKVVSQDANKSFQIKGFDADYFKSFKVSVIKEIAGSLKKNIVEINYKADCWRMIGIPETGSEYIFFANAINNNQLNGFVSSKWSATLDGIPKDEIDKIVKQIRDYRNGVKQPRVVGFLFKHKPNPYWDYVNQSFNGAILWRSENFDNNWRIKKWESDPEYSEPFKKIKVTVKNLEGVEIASTVTDSSGRFEFADLPKGNYVIYPDVPKTYLIVGKCYLNDLQKGGVGFRVTGNNQVCDRTIRLDVAPAGKFEAEIALNQGRWQDSSVPYIFLIGANSKTGEIYRNYLVNIPVSTNFDKKLSVAADKVMAGEYVLRIGTSMGSDIYYPGVSGVKKAKIFEIKEGATTKGDFSIASLKDK